MRHTLLCGELKLDVMENMRCKFKISPDEETSRLQLAFKTALVETRIEVYIEKLCTRVGKSEEMVGIASLFKSE